MKKKIIKIFIALIGLLLLGVIYLNSSVFIENQEWKYGGGTYIGDWLNRTNIEINDGVIYSYRGKAKIVFSTGLSLVIENIETNERGFYINKK